MKYDVFTIENEALRVEVSARGAEMISILDKAAGGIITHTVFRCPSKMGKGILVSPTVDGNLLTGPTSVDIEDKDDKRTTEEGFDYGIQFLNDKYGTPQKCGVLFIFHYTLFLTFLQDFLS